ncbi:Phosphatidylglycerophosphatase C [Candidatus Erwinia haradaeae]|uniref:Phosphatidylglycerophosphatase C n=1 Tax=Candidatus Erwinia haradaeae TaxID=1922217 RepID=A0A451DJ78_9GAMM|nr:phosphatidylglycerophosphatase C [Candidatus Erwinia haradaeae]VFP86742.1 Phosphatidylglycerophosphatase C [Candidatus Erwinia haradaeae]
MITCHRRRIIFFDLDGTLHQEDIFRSFIYWLLWHHYFNILLLLVVLPLIGLGLAINGRASCWPISLLLWSMTVGHSESLLIQREEEFTNWFLQRQTPHVKIHQRVIEHLRCIDTDIWLITGSPQALVERIYHNVDFFPHVQLIASQMVRSYGGRVLSMRCVGREKVAQLTERIGQPLQLESGYSDSVLDDPLLLFCQNRFRVTPSGDFYEILS